jgi:hypothetical protein
LPAVPKLEGRIMTNFTHGSNKAKKTINLVGKNQKIEE